MKVAAFDPSSERVRLLPAGPLSPEDTHTKRNEGGGKSARASSEEIDDGEEESGKAGQEREDNGVSASKDVASAAGAGSGDGGTALPAAAIETDENGKDGGTVEREQPDSSGGGGDDAEGEEVEYGTLASVRIARGPSIDELEKRKKALEKWNSILPGGVVGLRSEGDAVGKGGEAGGGVGGSLVSSSQTQTTPSKKGAAPQGARKQAGKAAASPKSIGKTQAMAAGTLAVGAMVRIVAAEAGKEVTGVGRGGTGAAPLPTVV